jgi:hypothetical protein
LLFFASVGEEDAVLCHFSLLFSQPPSVLRPVWQDEECHEADEDRNAAFDDEEPLPAVKARKAAHVLEDTRSQETGDDVRNGITSMPDRHPHGILCFRVP